MKVKADSIDSIFCGNKPIESLFDRGGVAYSPMLLGLNGFGDESSLHPIVYEINERGMAYFTSLDQLTTLQNYPEIGMIPEPTEVEYVPDMSTLVYFGSGWEQKHRYTTSLV